jgi:hypothetical protein
MLDHNLSRLRKGVLETVCHFSSLCIFWIGGDGWVDRCTGR